MTGGPPTLDDTLPDLTLRPPPASTTRKVRPSHPRGLFDFILAMLLVYGVYAKTPIGALAEWAIRAFVFDQEHSPSLFGTFRGRESNVEIERAHLEKGVLASLVFPTSIEEAHVRTRVDKELLAVLVATHGRCDGDACFVKAPPYLPDLLDHPVETEEVPVLEIAIGLAKGAIRFGSSAEVAVEALFVPPHAVERAVGQARASGLGASDDIEVHASFLPPSIRRGSLQEAMSVLALHRLRTLAWPVDADKRITSPFGYRIHPISGERRFHNGTDIGVANGTPLRSAHRGRVHRAGEDSISGKYVHLDHGFGILSTHCHMSEIAVRGDQSIERGQVVGLSGDTGRVTGPHLHYILRIDGKVVDPEAYGEAPRRHVATSDPLLPSQATAEVGEPMEGVKKPANKPPAKRPDKQKPAKAKKRPAKKKPPAPGGGAPTSSAPSSSEGPDAGDRDYAEGEPPREVAAEPEVTQAAETPEPEAPATDVRSTDAGPP